MAVVHQAVAGGHATVPADHVTLRRHNLALVVTHLRDAGPRSRARIAAETGLNKATVSSLVAELIERRLVHETTAERGAVGRPGQLVELDGRAVCGIGAEVNVDYVAVMALNLRGEVVHEHRLPLDTARLQLDVVLDHLATLVLDAAARITGRDGEIVGVTLAVSGMVRVATGHLFLAPNLGWRDVPVVAAVSQLLGEPDYPLLLDNEANLAAIAELSAGDSLASGDLLLLTGATGVGGGLISHGRLLRGGHGFSGEVGHMPVEPDGRQCGCGRIGCWETVVGLNALLLEATDPDDPARDPSLDVDQRLAELIARAEHGDTRTLSALRVIGGWLALGSTILVDVLDPEVLILGGYLAAFGKWLQEPLQAALRERAVAPEAGGCRVELSQLGFTAAVRGGAKVSTDAVFADPTIVPRSGLAVAAQPAAFESRGALPGTAAGRV